MVVALLAAIAAGAFLAPTVSDAVSLAKLACCRARRPRRSTPDIPPRLLFLVPAHNEEALITSCVQALRRLRYPADACAVWVVADNCSDRTAALARQIGARCLERVDPARSGKPHAVAWALAQLPIGDFDAVVIVDADAVVDVAFAQGLAAAAPLRAKVVQPFNGVRNPSDNAITRMAAVLAIANHQLAFALKTRVGLNVPLGAGMCIGTDILARHGWQAFSIGEDWELYALLTEHGVRTESAPGARLYAEEARSLRQSAPQRHRWAAGKLTVLGRYARRIVRSPHIGRHQKLDAIAELLGTGPAVHAGVAAVLAAVLLGMHVPGARILVLALAASLVRPVIYAGLALRRTPAPWRSAAAFLYLPLYTAWRLGVQLTALTMLGDKPWVRTPRNP
jgi:cellulose synthase/poly-beta-1,6-N-acetylglucosamine synthase-like glycosyltransferase